MKRLIRDLVVRHKKSLLLCTHLLGDVEVCCENLAILEGGRILGAGLLSTVKRATPNGYRIAWEGSRRRMLDRLRSDGVRSFNGSESATSSEDDGFHQAVLHAPDDYDSRRLFAAAFDAGSRIWKLEPDEEPLADVYHRLVGSHGAALSYDG